MSSVVSERSQMAQATDHQVIWLDPSRIRPFKDQPRKRFRNIPALARSIKEVGQTTPIKVKLVTDDPTFDAELIDGERRLRACILAGLQIKAEVDPDVGDADQQFAISVASNFGHEDHDNMEIAHAAKRFQDQDKSIPQIADIFGKSVAWVSQHLSLLKLHPDVQEMLVVPEEEESESVEGAAESIAPAHSEPRKRRAKLTFSLAILIVPLPPTLQLQAATHIVKQGLTLVSARRYILQLSQKTGHKVGRTRSPAEHFVNLEAMIRRMKDQLGIYMDMPNKDFQQILTSQPAALRRELTHSVQSFLNELEQFAQGIH